MEKTTASLMDKEVDFEEEIFKVINWKREKKSNTRPLSLEFQTNLEEVQLGIRFLNQVRLLEKKDFEIIFQKDASHIWGKWLEECHRPVGFLSRLDIGNLSKVGKYLQPATDFWILYRSHAFFRTLECGFATYLSESILGVEKTYCRDKQCGVLFFGTLTSDQQRKLIGWSNKLNNVM